MMWRQFGLATTLEFGGRSAIAIAWPGLSLVDATILTYPGIVKSGNKDLIFVVSSGVERGSTYPSSRLRF